MSIIKYRNGIIEAKIIGIARMSSKRKGVAVILLVILTT